MPSLMAITVVTAVTMGLRMKTTKPNKLYPMVFSTLLFKSLRLHFPKLAGGRDVPTNPMSTTIVKI